MKQNGQFVRVNEDFISKNLSAAAVKVLFLLASIAQAGGGNAALISNARISERTGLTNITRLMNELYTAGAVTERIQRFKNNRQRCNAYILSDTAAAPKNYVLVPACAVELPKSCLRLFLLYCVHADADGRCLLSLSMIQQLSGMARETIVSSTKELTARGFIAKQQYVRREGDFGYNRIYLSHVMRRRRGTRRAETFRVLVNSGRLDYKSKCEAENALHGNPTPEFLRIQRLLFRSTAVAAFIRRILRSINNAAEFFCPFWGSRKRIIRFINLKPVLII